MFALPPLVRTGLQRNKRASADSDETTGPI
jgi:hypothetical protein